MQDCINVDTNSPWDQSTKYGDGDGSGAQISSALPIRQGLLRSLQLSSNYDKMTPEKKQAFDQAHAHDLDPVDQVKILIWSSVMDDSQHPTLRSGPSTQAALRLSNGVLILPMQISLPDQNPSDFHNSITELTYIFPRSALGKLLYLPSDSLFVIELGAPLQFKKSKGTFNQPTPFRDSGRRYVFKIADMMYRGKLEY